MSHYVILHSASTDNRAGDRLLATRRSSCQQIYGTRSKPTDEWPSDIWTKLGGCTVEKKKQSFPLGTGDRRYRYYLVWITELSPGRDKVEITQLTLSAPKVQGAARRRW